ncbi:MAG: hypothetical protein M3P87_05030, partial [Actinomycetota bacterium]|nr:hypothetical protein [Actinomycetota bacterium]
ALMALLVAVLACGGGGNTETSITRGPGAESAVAAVETLSDLLIEGDFAGASSLAMPGQAALASLAEGATSGEVADALRTGDEAIAANFWSGFAQGFGEVLSGDFTVEEIGPQTESDVEFFLVSVTPESGSPRRLVTQDVDGYRVDLFASFGAGLAERLISPIEILVDSPIGDNAVILGALQEVVPSLLLAASDETLGSDAVQAVLRLVEVITRVG